MHLLSLTSALIGTAMLVAAPVQAQTAPAHSTPAKTTSTRVPTTTKTTRTNAPVQRTAKSLDCSKQADAKGLHGTARKHFMSTCKKA